MSVHHIWGEIFILRPDFLVFSPCSSKYFAKLLNSRPDNVLLVSLFTVGLIPTILKSLKSWNNDLLRLMFLLETIQSKYNKNVTIYE
jgi:hypothetical protein